MSSFHPLVSIVVPSYNGEEFLTKLIKNVSRQSYKDFEIIIVVDGVVDGTVDLIRELTRVEKRLKVIINKTNLGASASRNIGMNAAQGKYLAFLDQDDLWHTHKLEKQIRVLESSPKTMAVFCQYAICKIVDDNLILEGAFKFKKFDRMYKNWLNIKGDGPALASTLMVRNVGNTPRFREDLFALYDIEYFRELKKIGEVIVLDDFLTIYVQHPRQMHRDFTRILELSRLGDHHKVDRAVILQRSKVYSKVLKNYEGGLKQIVRNIELNDFTITISTLFWGIYRRSLRKLVKFRYVSVLKKLLTNV